VFEPQDLANRKKHRGKGVKEEERIGIWDTHPSLEERIKKIEGMKISQQGQDKEEY